MFLDILWVTFINTDTQNGFKLIYPTSIEEPNNIIHFHKPIKSSESADIFKCKLDEHWHKEWINIPNE